MTLTVWQKAQRDPAFRERVLEDLQRAGLAEMAARKLMESKAKADPPASSGLEGILEDLRQKLGDLEARMASIEERLMGLVGDAQASDERALSKALDRLLRANERKRKRRETDGRDRPGR